jgi:pimeloyl-ACP methyl ester carboxylesterase
VAGSLLDHPVLAGRLFFPRRSAVSDPFWVTASDGMSRLACFRAMPHPGAPTIVHFHGNGEVVSDYVPDMAEEFAKVGVNVMLAEYRGYGGSTGASPALGGMLEDAAAVLAASGARPENVIAFGRSLGSLFAIELAARYPNLRGLILESGIADPLERTPFRVTPEELGVSQAELAAAIASRLDQRAKLGRYRGPLLVLHAANDQLVAPLHAERNFAWSAAASDDKELVLFARGNHNSIFLSNYVEYLEALRRFLARFGVRPQPAGVE